MTRRLVLVAVTVTSTVIGVREWWRRHYDRWESPTPSGFMEAVVYHGPHTIVMSPAVDGLPRRIEPGMALLVDQDFAADLVEISPHWSYLNEL